MARFTKNDLIFAIEEVNKELRSSGSNYNYVYGNRNGYHAVDLCRGDKVVNCLDCNETPRKLAERLEDDYSYYLEK